MVCVVVGGIRGLRVRLGLGWRIGGGRRRYCGNTLGWNCGGIMIYLDLLECEGEVGYLVSWRRSLEASLLCRSRGQWPGGE